MQPLARPPRGRGEERRARRGRLPAGVRHDLGVRRHLDGPRRDALLAGEPRGHRRLGRDGVRGRAPRRRRAARRLRQVRSPRCSWPRRGSTWPRSSSTPGRSCPGRVGDKDVTIIDAFEAVGACARGLITRERGRRDRARHLPGRGRLRRHVHREHDGRRRRGDGHEPARLRRAAGRRPSSRRLRAALRPGRRRAAPRRHHDPRHHHARSRCSTRSPSSWRSAARPTPCCTCWRSRTRRTSSSTSRTSTPSPTRCRTWPT